MLSRETLKTLLQRSDLTQTTRSLLCLASRDPEPLQIRQIKRIGIDAGLPAMSDWNVSRALKRSEGYAVRGGDGWELTDPGRKAVAEISGEVAGDTAPKLAAVLRDHMEMINQDQTRAFVEEAVRCFEYRLYRSAVVFSWLGAVAVLQDYVVERKLREFNKEAQRRNSQWNNAINRDDLAEMKEWQFLQILRSISVIGKSTKLELENCLQRRNACGHPNDYRVGGKMAAAHLETLIDNVYAKL